MPRPCRRRCIQSLPAASFFKPAGIPASALDVVTLGLDEFEAVRLADLEGMYQEDAAAQMSVSRQTFGNILIEAHRKISDALVRGKALRIEGGAIQIAERKFICNTCKHEWSLPCGTGRPQECPECKSADLYCAYEQHECGRVRQRGQCRRRTE